MNDTEKLEDENKKLREALDAKSDLISISAHQLRTSLSALKWTLEMLHQKDLGEINPEQADYLGKAITSNERMISLVSRMLSFNHADKSVPVLEKKEVNIEALLTEILFEFSGETRKKNISITLEKPSSVIPTITADPDMIRVVLESIIENAIKYNSQDGTISISLKAQHENKALSIAIHDTGIGITKEDAAHIFDKFFRSANAEKANSVGSGLGLFIARVLLKQHGGSISFESKPGDGTTFFITIPIA